MSYADRGPEWRQVLRRLRLGGSPRSPEEQVDEEIRFHLEERTRTLMAEGLAADAARREAERRFGSVSERRRELLDLTQGRRRAMSRRFSMAVWFEAFRSAFRVLVRRPLPAVAAILSLGFGLAAVTGVGTLADELLLRPPAGLTDPGSLVYIDATPSSPGLVADTLRMALNDAASNATRETDGAFTAHLPGSLFAVRGSGDPERVIAMGVDGGYFRTLGVKAARGRLLDATDDAERRQVVVISRDLAMRHFSRAEPVGRTLRVEGRPFVVVGVVDPAFRGTFHGFPNEMWMPFQVASDLDGTFDPDDLEADAVEMMARLPAGTSRESLAARIDAAVAGLRQSHPELAQLHLEVHPLTGFDPETWLQVVAFVVLLFAVALGLLAVAASPVAMWLLARAQQRHRELAIRAALGGGRFQLALLLAAEGVWVGALGGILGLGFAMPAPALAAWLLPPLPFDPGIKLALSPGLALAVLGLAMSVGSLAALPAWVRLAKAERRGAALSAGLRGRAGSGAAGGAGSRLVVAQLAVACALLVVAGALVSSVRDTAATEPGVDLDAVTVAQRLDIGSLRDDRATFYADLAREAADLPGVEAVGITSRFPLSLFGSRRSAVSAPGVDPNLDLEALGTGPAGRKGMQDEVHAAAVDPGYFAAAGVELLRGRGFTAADASAAGGEAPLVAVVNQTLALRWFGSEAEADAVGRRLRIDGLVHTLVGVAATGRYGSVGESDLPFVYVAVAQAPPPRIDLVLRSRRPVAELSVDVRALLARLEPDLPSPALLSGREVVAARLLPQRLAAGICAVLGVVGLLLASFAVYAVAAWRVSSRQREFGIRLGLGASPSNLRRAILVDGLRLAGLGLALGSGLGWLGARGAVSVVPDVVGAGPGVYLAVAGVLGLAALLAGIGPAYRAGRVDPAEILRGDAW